MSGIRSTVLTLTGIAWLAVSLHPKTMRDRRRGVLREWRTARALKSKLKKKRLARGRIFGHGPNAAEVDLLVATPNAIHVVETKYRQCRRIWPHEGVTVNQLGARHGGAERGEPRPVNTVCKERRRDRRSRWSRRRRRPPPYPSPTTGRRQTRTQTRTASTTTTATKHTCEPHRRHATVNR